MGEKILTIVIPSYNTSIYIDQCLQSLAKIETDKLDVIVVDDGSKDDTFEKAKEYEKRYPQMFRAIHKENGGHGSAINTGLSYAIGKYFRVLDGDDWVDSKALSDLLDVLFGQDSDMILTDIVQVFPDRTNLQKFFVRLQRGKPYDIDSLPQIDYLTLGSITIKTEILIEHDLRLTEHCYYEDVEFCSFCLAYANNIVIYDFSVYMYRLGNPDQSVDKANMVKNIEMFKRISLGLLPFYESIKPKDDNSRKELLLLRIGKLIRTTMLLHLADKDIKNGYMLLCDYSHKVKDGSPEIYRYIKKKWFIIKLLCSESKMVFKVLSTMYKRRFLLK